MLRPTYEELKAPPAYPRLWRLGSRFVMGTTGLLFAALLRSTQQRPELQGLEDFTRFLDRRTEEGQAARGLLTVSNHISVLDDPGIWSYLPARYRRNPATLRWALGAKDVIFTNPIFARFFLLGQTLPTHRRGIGPYQPSLDMAVDLLNRGAWVHIFPEAKVHQHPLREMRYFKWGVSRLLLEPASVPTVVPLFFDGLQEVMHEDRSFPRFLPRPGKKVRIRFGTPMPADPLAALRSEWADMLRGRALQDVKDTPEGISLRIRAADIARHAVAQVRRELGFGEESPAAKLAATYRSAERQKQGRQAGDVYEKDAPL